MSDIFPIMPQNWKVSGCLRDTQDPELLNGTMFSASDPGRQILVYAGWEPEEDPSGHYVIGVLRGCDLIEGPFYTKNATVARSRLERLARSYAGKTLFAGSNTQFRNLFVASVRIVQPIRQSAAATTDYDVMPDGVGACA